MQATLLNPEFPKVGGFLVNLHHLMIKILKITIHLWLTNYLPCPIDRKLKHIPETSNVYRKKVINHLKANEVPLQQHAYSVKETQHVELTIYNVLGQIVKILIDEVREPGTYTVNWDRKDERGDEIESGVYFYRIGTRDYTEIKKMILLQ